MAKKVHKQIDETIPDTPQTAARESGFLASETFWRAGAAFVLLIAAALRFLDLPLKPFHHDEGVNGYFLINLVRNGVYHYDPSNYHGPTLYFFAQAAVSLFGLNDYAVRGVTALFGVLIIAGILSLRRYLGTVGALTAALLVAVSPGMVYISRYFIHEILFVFFAFGVVLGVVKFFERERAGIFAVAAISLVLLACLLPGTLNFANALTLEASDEARSAARAGFFLVECFIVFLLVRALLNWNGGRPIYLLLAAASAVLTFATKETAFITFGTMIIACVCVVVWQSLRGGKLDLFGAADGNSFFQSLRLSYVDTLFVGLLCAAVFAYVGALFFSSFFTYNQGIYGAFEAYDFWTKTGNKDHTQNGFFAYFKWLLKIESPLLILGAIGAGLALWKWKNYFALFCALWAFGLLAAYTLIPYKTPWLAVNFVMPLGLIAGYGINELANSRDALQRGTAAFFAALAFGMCAYQTVDLNFVRYDDNEKPYIYAHTTRDFLNLVTEIERVAAVSGKNKEASIIIVSKDYWGLPWYLRDYKNAAFYGQMQPSSTAEMVVGSQEQDAELKTEFSRHYQHTGTYNLRPGVDLQLWVRKDLADK